MKNIWILNHYAKTPDMPGGTRHYDFGKQFTNFGHKVIIFASAFDNINKKNIKVNSNISGKIEDHNGVKFVWLKTFPYKKNDWRRIVNMFSYGVNIGRNTKNCNKPDVIIGSSMHPIAVLAAWWLARRYKARFIFEIRDLWPQTPIDMGKMNKNNIIAKILFLWEKQMCSKADCIVTLLPYVEEYIKEKNINYKNIVWIPNGVNLEYYKNPIILEEQKINKDFEEKKNKFRIIYAGAIGQANSLEIILDTCNILKNKGSNTQFFLFGEGVAKKRLIRKAKELNLKNITFCDPVIKREIPFVLSKADCLFIHMSDRGIRKYGVSQNKVFDYLASGKPIILAGNPPNNIVKEANAGITIEPDNPELLANTIIQLAKLDKNKINKIGENGRKFVEKYYDVKVLAKKFEEIF